MSKRWLDEKRFKAFKVLPKSKHGRKIRGVGINDVEYATNYRNEDGSVEACQIYNRWYAMMNRCYSADYHTRQSTYKDCTVCEEWLLFSNFRKWMLEQDWFGKQLDKDLKISGNKVYSPETCMFITSEINSLLVDCRSARGKYPVGVYYHKRDKQYRAQLNMNGKNKLLGRFDTPEEASKVFLDAKAAYVREVAIEQEPFLRSCLERIAGEIERGEYYV